MELIINKAKRKVSLTQLERIFMNLQLRYQILIPVAIAISIMALSLSVIIQSYDKLSANSLAMDYNSIDSAKLTYAQEKLLHLRIITSRALGNPNYLKSADKEFIETNRAVLQLLSEVKASANVTTSTDEFQRRMTEVQVLIGKYGADLQKVKSDYEQMDTAWMSLPWISDYIDQANNIIMASNVSLEEETKWAQIRQALYSSSTKIIVRMSSVHSLDLLPQFEKDLIENFNIAFTEIEKLNNKEAKKVLEQGFNTYSAMNGMLWESGRGILQYSDNIVASGTKADDILAKTLSELIQRTHDLTVGSTGLITDSESMLLASLTFIILFSILTGWFVARIIIRPILRIQDQMAYVAKGDLTDIINYQGTNEVGTLCKYTDDTVRNLQTLIFDLRNVGDEVSSASTELAAVMVESEANANDQKGQVEQISTAVTELSASATQVDASANQAELRVKEVLELTLTGSKIANESAQLSHSLAMQMDVTSEEVNVLKEQTDKISEVITVIDSISEQTNLLALNAAIEAARAGESGRGFAVVADEVRVLAAKTQKSTQDIQRIIDNLQQKSSDVVTSVSDSIKIIHETTRMSQETNEQLDNISVAIDMISQTNSEMANAANEQSRAISSISENVSTISESINQNVEGIKETAQASNHLSELSEGQKAKLSFFNV
ncbi:chemotaxis protein [Aliivibrio sp. 1S128]|nr:chemotaxis protein [Aliivibrio sp. 1S128]